MVKISLKNEVRVVRVLKKKLDFNKESLHEVKFVSKSM